MKRDWTDLNEQEFWKEIEDYFNLSWRTPLAFNRLRQQMNVNSNMDMLELIFKNYSEFKNRNNEGVVEAEEEICSKPTKSHIEIVPIFTMTTPEMNGKLIEIKKVYSGKEVAKYIHEHGGSFGTSRAEFFSHCEDYEGVDAEDYSPKEKALLRNVLASAYNYVKEVQND